MEALSAKNGLASQPLADAGVHFRAASGVHMDMPVMAEHLLLVDCSAFAYRAFYSAPSMRREDSGEPTGAVLGFMSLIWNMLGAASVDNPTMGAAVFDAPGKTFRHKLLPSYKGNRDPARKLELEKQLPLMRPVAEVLGFKAIEKKGFEADDLLATLAHAARLAGIRSTIITSDKDLGQCVVDGWIEIVDPMQRYRDPAKSARRLEADVTRKFGVEPRLVPQVQALAGDPVDGIPGLQGCGLDTAARLIRSFGSLDEVLRNADKIRFPVIRAALKRKREGKTGAEWVKLYLKATTLRCDVPLVIDFESMHLRPVMRVDLEHLVKRLNPNANVTAVFGIDRQNERTVAKSHDDFEWWREELIAPGQTLPAIPSCGFYKRRLVKGGAEVPARIWRSARDAETETLQCEVDGKARDAFAEFTRLAQQPITEEEFKFMSADSAHAKAYRPGHPKSDPTKAPDLSKQPAPRNPRKKS